MNDSPKFERPPLALILALCLGLLAVPLRGQDVTVSLQGKIVDGQGRGIPGANIKLIETPLTTISGAEGVFDLTGSFQVGVLRRAPLPGGGRLEFRGDRLTLVPSGAGRAHLISPSGKVRRFSWRDGGPMDVTGWLGDGGSGAWLLKLEQVDGSRSFRLLRQGRGKVILMSGAPAPRKGGPLAKAAVDSTALVLEVSSTGHLTKRFFEGRPVKSGLSLALLPASATRREVLQDFIGAERTFRLAYLKKDPASGSRKHVLHYVDFAEMAGDSLPEHAFPDSKGPAETPFGANVPSWSPDGRMLAYEIGAENQTVNNVSRIPLQPLQGARADGPAFPATNPRWHVRAGDTSLLWSTSGREDAWQDSAASTLRQKVAGGALSGAAERVAQGAWNGGLSADGRYLATAFRHGVMMEMATGARRHLHIYPGQPPARDGSSADSLQSCNPSISPDPARSSRMLFLDFGVPTGENPYPNLVRPRNYAQHQVILIGDFHSDAPGRIVDFIDSPAEELARERTWDDPEWSNHPDFAVASTRDPDGDLSNPGEPRPTQPDIYLIHLPTKTSVKAVSGVHQIMPALWVGPKP